MITQAAAPAESWRLFVALRVPHAVADAVVAAARSVPPPAGSVRWVDPADLHVTLWFIGHVAATRLPALRDRLAGVAADAAPFDVELAGTGTFGGGRGRATWVGLTAPGAGRVAALAAQLDGGSSHAHVTVCRGTAAAFADALAGRLADAPSVAWRVMALELLRSHPGRRPAYETIGRFPLGVGA